MSEDEIDRVFPAFDVGTLPPFSALLRAPESSDVRLLACHRILCSGGDHRHTLEISPHEIERLGNPLVATLLRLGPAFAAQPIVALDRDVNAIE